jgi:TRAP-type mannitol/chloroaromatic compound transport system permease small subunit
MQKFLLGYVKAVDAMTEFLGAISMHLVWITVAVGFYNVVVRYTGRFTGLQLSSNVFIETQWYLYSLVFFFGFAYILKNGINVRVDFLYANFSEKRRALIDFVGHLLFLIPFTVLGIYVTINPVLSSWGRLPNGGWGTWEMSPDPDGLPRAPIKTMIILAFISLFLQTVAELIKLWGTLTEQEEFIILSSDTEDVPLRIE